MWIRGALLAAFAFIASLRSATERITLRFLRVRKQRRRRRQWRRLATAYA